MSYEALLEIQRVDIETDRLNHRRINMPERGELEAALVEQGQHQIEIDAVAAARVQVANRQRRFEDEALTIAAKADIDHVRLYSGEVKGMKDLEALQHEITSLRARQTDLEDRALEAMEEAEELAGRIGSLEASRADVDSRINSLEADIIGAETEIDHSIDEASSARNAAVAQLDPAIVERYEGLRPALGAATVVQFDGSNCSGCPSVMPAMEVDRVKHESSGSLLECGECGRMVLR